MGIPIEVFSSARGAFVAAPPACELFAASGLVLERGSRMLRGVSPDGSAIDVGRVPVGALHALCEQVQLPVVAFGLGGICEAVMLQLTVNG